MINVTKTYLPNKEQYKKYIDEIYANGWITNNGPMVQLLEKRLSAYLGVKNLVLVSNVTVALEIAYRTLEIESESACVSVSVNLCNFVCSHSHLCVWLLSVSMLLLKFVFILMLNMIRVLWVFKMFDVSVPICRL